MAFKKRVVKSIFSPITPIIEKVFVPKMIVEDGSVRTIVTVEDLDVTSKEASDMLPLAEEFDYETQLKTGVVLENVINPSLLNPTDSVHISQRVDAFVEESASKIKE